MGGMPGGMPEGIPDDIGGKNPFGEMFDSAANYITEVDSAMNLTGTRVRLLTMVGSWSGKSTTLPSTFTVTLAEVEGAAETARAEMLSMDVTASPIANSFLNFIRVSPCCNNRFELLRSSIYGTTRQIAPTF